MRVENWEKKLADYIEENRNKKFDMPNHNCGSFTLEWEKVLTNQTRFPEFYQKFKSVEDFMKILNKYGFKSWISLCNKRLTKISTKLAKRGDLVCVRQKNSFCMGICLGQKCAFLGNQKMEFFSLDEVCYAWRLD